MYDYSHESRVNYALGKFKNDLNANKYDNKKIIGNESNYMKFRKKKKNSKKLDIGEWRDIIKSRNKENK